MSIRKLRTCCRRGWASGRCACGPPSWSPSRAFCCAGVTCEFVAEVENSVMGNGIPVTGQPARMSPSQLTGQSGRKVVRLLREPFTRCAWTELLYTIASLPLAIAGFLFTAATLVAGTGLSLTIAGIVIGPLLVAASTKGVRSFGAASRGMAGRLLGVQVAAPRPLHPKPGAAGWFWLGGLGYLTYPLWWEIFHQVPFSAGGVTQPDPVTNPGPIGSIHV